MTASTSVQGGTGATRKYLATFSGGFSLHHGSPGTDIKSEQMRATLVRERIPWRVYLAVLFSTPVLLGHIFHRRSGMQGDGVLRGELYVAYGYHELARVAFGKAQ